MNHCPETLPRTISPEISGDEEQESDLLKKRCGLLMIKPDAINLGVEEYVIAEFCSRLQGKASLDLVEVITITSEKQVQNIYPHASQNLLSFIVPNLLNQRVILVSFNCKSNTNLWKDLSAIKGPNPKRWSVAMHEGDTRPHFFIRGWLPVPGSSPVWKKIIAKIKGGDELTQQEYLIYCQNLVHTPDTIQEFEGLLSLSSGLSPRRHNSISAPKDTSLATGSS